MTRDFKSDGQKKSERSSSSEGQRERIAEESPHLSPGWNTFRPLWEVTHMVYRSRLTYLRLDTTDARPRQRPRLRSVAPSEPEESLSPPGPKRCTARRETTLEAE